MFQENLEYYIGIEKNSEGNWVSVTGEKWFDGACSYERFSVCEF